MPKCLIDFILCCSKKLSAPGTFPLKLQDNIMQWKLALYYEVESGNFLLIINDKAFLSMPFKASLSPTGPKNIEQGYITLNGVEVHSGFAQCTAGMMAEWCAEHSIESITAASIGGDILDGFKCTSSEALNLVFEDLARSIDYEEGLRIFKIGKFVDQNTLEEWPLNQLLSKCHRLQELTIIYLDTTDANRIQILEFAGLAATSSSCLSKL